MIVQRIAGVKCQAAVMPFAVHIQHFNFNSSFLPALALVAADDDNDDGDNGGDGGNVFFRSVSLPFPRRPGTKKCSQRS